MTQKNPKNKPVTTVENSVKAVDIIPKNFLLFL